MPASAGPAYPRSMAVATDRRVHPWGALGVLCVSILVVNLDNTILNVALPTLVRKLNATSSELQWIVDSYAMVFAGLLLVGGSLRRPVRPQASVPDRPDGVRLRVGRRGLLRLGGAADRVACGDGSRRRADDAGDALDHQRRLPRSPRALARDRPLGGNERHRDSDRPDRRRPAALPLLVGLGVLRQRPHRRRGRSRRRAARAGLAESGRKAPRSARRPPVYGRPRVCSLGDHRGPHPRLVVDQSRRRRSRRSRRARSVRRVGSPDRPSDAESDLLPGAPVLGGDVVALAGSLRPVRRAVRAVPVSAIRPAPVADRGGRAHSPGGRRRRG